MYRLLGSVRIRQVALRVAWLLVPTSSYCSCLCRPFHDFAASCAAAGAGAEQHVRRGAGGGGAAGRGVLWAVQRRHGGPGPVWPPEQARTPGPTAPPRPRVVALPFPACEGAASAAPPLSPPARAVAPPLCRPTAGPGTAGGSGRLAPWATLPRRGRRQVHVHGGGGHRADELRGPGAARPSPAGGLCVRRLTPAAAAGRDVLGRGVRGRDALPAHQQHAGPRPRKRVRGCVRRARVAWLNRERG